MWLDSTYSHLFYLEKITKTHLIDIQTDQSRRDLSFMAGGTCLTNGDVGNKKLEVDLRVFDYPQNLKCKQPVKDRAQKSWTINLSPKLKVTRRQA